MNYLLSQKSLFKRAVHHLLEIKDSEIRLLNLHQCRHAIDNSIHIGGAFSATIPMVSLFYGGIIELNIEEATATDQDQFVLSKGHAVATLASIYSDLGYFDSEILKNSRSIKSILNGHPGPLLPGVHVATGPMGQGIGVAQGFAIAGQKNPKFDVFAITGDGELQEGPVWEAVMYAGFKRLENLCVMVDQNGGQLDTVNNLHFPYHNLAGSFQSFGWRVFEVDATNYAHVHEALFSFKHGPRDGRPTVIICKSTKGHGGFSSFMNNHKTALKDELLNQEVILQENLLRDRKEGFMKFYSRIGASPDHRSLREKIAKFATEIGFEETKNEEGNPDLVKKAVKVRLKKAQIRDKKITYEDGFLPKLEVGKPYSAHQVIEAAMKIMAKDRRIFSIDSDLASTSGLQAGVGFVDQARGLNVGVAEANMMLIGEALAILGSNVWVSTFCPFFDWKVLRRIAVGHQERLEVIADNGWLSEGHAIDLTMVATAADLETQSNGATHMGNDDVMMINESAHVKIINVSCPQQLLGVMKWIAEGNKGIIYLRVLRAAAQAIYPSDFEFVFGKSYKVWGNSAPQASIVSTGRGVHEAIDACKVLEKEGLHLEVIDMPSIDEKSILKLYEEGKPLFVAEQNNGFLWNNIIKILFNRFPEITTNNLHPINLSTTEGLHYIHSGTYQELASHFNLDSEGIKQYILKKLNK